MICPTCRALPGELCLDLRFNGERTRITPHSARVDLIMATDQEVLGAHA